VFAQQESKSMNFGYWRAFHTSNNKRARMSVEKCQNKMFDDVVFELRLKAKQSARVEFFASVFLKYIFQFCHKNFKSFVVFTVCLL